MYHAGSGGKQRFVLGFQPWRQPRHPGLGARLGAKLAKLGENFDTKRRAELNAGAPGTEWGLERQPQSWFEIAIELDGEHAEDASVLLAEQGYEGCEYREAGAGRTVVVVYMQADEQASARARVLA